MPELPEVETVRRQLQRSLPGKTVKDVFVYTDKMVHVGAGKISNIKVGSARTTKKFAAALRGKKFLCVRRRAKFLLFDLSGGMHLAVHLRMSGQLIYVRKRDLQNPLLLSLAASAVRQTLPSKHTHVEFTLRGGDKLFYNDTRQFGHIRLVNDSGMQRVFAEHELGPEPLTLGAEKFAALVEAHPQKRAKDFLLNQQVIAGIGNIYADESLFRAGINPLRKMRTLSKPETRQLYAAIKAVLQKAIRLGGSSVEYFLMTNGTAGKFSEQHLVYAKAGKPCPRCGELLVSRKIGSRTSTFCRYCQT